VFVDVTVRLRLIRGGVARRRGAALAVHPPGITAQVVLLFPDRQSVLHLVDDVTAGAERLVAVRGAHSHPHGELADRESADAMHARPELHPQ